MDKDTPLLVVQVFIRGSRMQAELPRRIRWRLFWPYLAFGTIVDVIRVSDV